MEFKFTKKQIAEMARKDSKKCIVYEKRDLKLQTEGNAYVEPSSDSASSIQGDLDKTKAKNPTDKEFVTNLNSYDGNSANNPVTIDVQGKTTADAAKNLQQTANRPEVRSLMSKGNVNAKIHLSNESLERLRENSVKFTKKEFKKFMRI
jgi:hypothetical protein